MKLFLAGMPDLYCTQQSAIEAGAGQNFLVPFCFPKRAEAYVEFVGLKNAGRCPCGKQLIRVGKYYTCPDVIRQLGTPEDIARLEEML
jgi:hypothetical protein